MKINIINSTTYETIDRFMINNDLQEAIERVRKVYPASRIECGDGIINVYK